MWKESGPLKVWLPPSRPETLEGQAVHISLVVSSCSRAEWMEFVDRVKAGDFDVPTGSRDHA